MKKEHVYMIYIGAIGIILGIILSAFIVAIFDTDSTQTEAEAETQVETQPEVEEASSTEPRDAEFVKSMPERDQAHLIAIICLATEKGNAPSDVAESIAENFDAISEEYAQRLVSASLLTVCKEISE